MAPLVYALVLVPMLALGILLAARPARCPSCRAPAVRAWWQRRSHPKPSPSFYRCESCGMRLQRLFDGPWEDASAAEYDDYYKDAPPLPPSPVGSYRGAPTRTGAGPALKGPSRP